MQKHLKIDKIHPLPHCRARTEKIKYIIIHCSRSSPEKQIEHLESIGLSAHYIIGKDGSLTKAVDPELVAYHAGDSKWYDSSSKSLNGTSIGIEIESPRMGQTQKSYSVQSIETLCNLLEYLRYTYKIRKENILGHSDIAPARKPDPGAKFPWKKLYQNDLIFWYHDHSLARSTDEVTLLQAIGYDTKVLEAARYAFCRRYLPEEVIVDKDIQHLVDNPYPPDFYPKDKDKYLIRLRAVCKAINQERQRHYWYLER